MPLFLLRAGARPDRNGGERAPADGDSTGSDRVSDAANSNTAGTNGYATGTDRFSNPSDGNAANDDATNAEQHDTVRSHGQRQHDAAWYDSALDCQQHDCEHAQHFHRIEYQSCYHEWRHFQLLEPFDELVDGNHDWNQNDRHRVPKAQQSASLSSTSNAAP